MAHGANCSEVRGIFPDQGSNLCLLHWQVDSLPLSHQGSLRKYYSNIGNKNIGTHKRQREWESKWNKIWTLGECELRVHESFLYISYSFSISLKYFQIIKLKRKCPLLSNIWLECSVQLLSCVQLFAIPHTAAHQASLSIANSQSLLKLMSIESVMPSNHHILCHPLLLPAIFPSIRVFSNESVLRIRWSNYWNFSFSITPSNEYSGLIAFRIDWFDLLTVWGTLRSLFQHHSSKASILWFSPFFMVQFTYLYMTTG